MGVLARSSEGPMEDSGGNFEFSGGRQPRHVSMWHFPHEGPAAPCVCVTRTRSGSEGHLPQISFRISDRRIIRPPWTLRAVFLLLCFSSFTVANGKFPSLSCQAMPHLNSNAGESCLLNRNLYGMQPPRHLHTARCDQTCQTRRMLLVLRIRGASFLPRISYRMTAQGEKMAL